MPLFMNAAPHIHLPVDVAMTEIEVESSFDVTPHQT